MTEQTSGGTEKIQLPTTDIEFRGRTIAVRMPRPEQLLVWRRTLRGLQSANPEGWSGDEIMAALERSRKLVDSLLVNHADVDWLDDEMLDGAVTLPDTNAIILDAMKAFQEEADQTRKDVPVKRATRKRTKK